MSALSGAADTPGTTYLLAGSDSRADGAVQDGFNESERADSIMLVNVAPNGQKVALSIPRDTYAEIPGVGWDKINASYAYGGPELLVETVEKLTGLTVDHFVQIGMGAVPDMVDAVGGVELCYDNDADDQYSGLKWTAGCHTVDGTTALQFSRMRYQDPEAISDVRSVSVRLFRRSFRRLPRPQPSLIPRRPCAWSAPAPARSRWMRIPPY